MKILYNGWEEWILSKGKEIKVGDGTRKTYHYVMGTWYDEETPESKETIDESENEDGFGIGGGYSSDRGRSGSKGRSLYCLKLNCRAPPGWLLQPDLTGWWRDV